MIAIILFELLIVSAAGLIAGSFATALAWRIPRGISWVTGAGVSAPLIDGIHDSDVIDGINGNGINDNGINSDGDGRAAVRADHGASKSAARSACPSCGTVLAWRDLIPLISWLSTGGRCRYCRARISVRYPAMEVACLTAALLAWGACGFTAFLVFVIVLIPFLVALAEIDIRYMILPDQLNLICGAVGAGWLLYLGVMTGDWAEGGRAVMAALVYAGIFWVMGFVLTKILKKDSLGLGDVKFMLVAGLWLGLGILPLYMIFAGLLGVVFGGIWRLSTKEAVFPFGPALILAFYVCLLVKEAGFSIPYGLYSGG